MTTEQPVDGDRCEVCGRPTKAPDPLRAGDDWCDWRTCHISQYDYQAECYRLGYERLRAQQEKLTERFRDAFGEGTTADNFVEAAQGMEIALHDSEAALATAIKERESARAECAKMQHEVDEGIRFDGAIARDPHAGEREG